MLPLLDIHVLKGIKKHAGIEKHDHDHVVAADGIHGEFHMNAVRERKKRHSPPEKDCEQSQQIGDKHDRSIERTSGSGLHGNRGDCDARDHRKQDRA